MIGERPGNFLHKKSLAEKLKLKWANRGQQIAHILDYDHPMLSESTLFLKVTLYKKPTLIISSYRCRRKSYSANLHTDTHFCLIHTQLQDC